MPFPKSLQSAYDRSAYMRAARENRSAEGIVERTIVEPAADWILLDDFNDAAIREWRRAPNYSSFGVRPMRNWASYIVANGKLLGNSFATLQKSYSWTDEQYETWRKQAVAALEKPIVELIGFQMDDQGPMEPVALTMKRRTSDGGGFAVEKTPLHGLIFNPIKMMAAKREPIIACRVRGAGSDLNTFSVKAPDARYLHAEIPLSKACEWFPAVRKTVLDVALRALEQVGRTLPSVEEQAWLDELLVTAGDEETMGTW